MPSCRAQSTVSNSVHVTLQIYCPLTYMRIFLSGGIVANLNPQATSEVTDLGAGKCYHHNPPTSDPRRGIILRLSVMEYVLYSPFFYLAFAKIPPSDLLQEALP